MARPTNAEIYDAEFKAANGNVSSRTIALSAMFTLQKLMEKERKSRKKEKLDGVSIVDQMRHEEMAMRANGD